MASLYRPHALVCVLLNHKCVIPCLRIILPADEESMSSFKSYLLREERRFDRISVICSESASLDVLRDLRNATKELRLPPDNWGTRDPKVHLLFPTIKVKSAQIRP